ncbi:MAG: hypothetical protein M1438_08585, partial [Deltaproteobacteria bacterium]|nr:hypothetical protein [Deltaproteobacteria bacterium]
QIIKAFHRRRDQDILQYSREQEKVISVQMNGVKWCVGRTLLNLILKGGMRFAFPPYAFVGRDARSAE